MADFEDLVAGRNSVTEAIRSGRSIDKIYVKQGDATLTRIISLAKDKKIPLSYVLSEKLSEMCPGVNHQGIVARVAAKEYSTIDDILGYAMEKGEDPFIIICDRIEDPRNLGAIIRSTNASGAHGVVIAKHEAAGLSAVVDKTSAGALSYTHVAKVTNIGKTIEDLKKQNIWVAGAAMNGSDVYKTDLKGPLALVIGNEGSGIGRLVSEKCDFLVSIPMLGKTESLNASCAASVLMYEVLRQRNYR